MTPAKEQQLERLTRADYALTKRERQQLRKLLAEDKRERNTKSEDEQLLD